MTALPTVVASSVVRSSQKGESHGAVYLVDLETECFEQVVDFDDEAIDWSGRGGERGLRGIALHGGYVYLASGDEVAIYSQGFERVGSLTNRYLGDIHEISISGGSLYVCSTAFDSLLVYDLEGRRFTQGYCLRQKAPGRRLGLMNRLGVSQQSPPARLARWARNRVQSGGRANDVRPRLFDPEASGGPEPQDTIHLNMACAQDGALFIAGARLRQLVRLRGERLAPYHAIPLGTHNARPYGSGIVYNDTTEDRLVFHPLDGDGAWSCMVPRYPDGSLAMADLPANHARQAFARGLCATEDGLLIAGSSPATVSVYDPARGERIKSVNLTMDVRNAIHGLEIWPF